jgi:hypothetical protein
MPSYDLTAVIRGNLRLLWDVDQTGHDLGLIFDHILSFHYISYHSSVDSVICHLNIRPKAPHDSLSTPNSYSLRAGHFLSFSFFSNRGKCMWGSCLAICWWPLAVLIFTFFHLFASSSSTLRNTFRHIIMKNFGSVLAFIALSASVVSARALPAENGVEARAPHPIGMLSTTVLRSN